MADIYARANGSYREVSPMNGQCYTLLELQAYVGGYIEIVELFNNRLLVVNEEGKMHGLPHNAIATAWMVATGRKDYVAGDALLVDAKNIK